MKQHLSVLMLLARRSIWKLLACFLASCAVQAALFLPAWQRTSSLSNCFSRLKLVCGAAFLIWTAILLYNGMDTGSRSAFTLRRLAVPERGVLLWQAAYNTLAYLLFLLFEGLLLLLLTHLWALRANPANGQLTFLTLYRLPLLYNFFPLMSVFRILRNVLYALCLGTATACAPLLQRRGSRPIAGVALAVLALFTFVLPVNWTGEDIMFSVVALLFGAGALYRTWQKAGAADEAA